MSKVMIALDFKSKNEVEQFLNQFEDGTLYVKIGMKLFYGQGLEILEMIKQRQHQIFLDLKLHDIPHTVYSAMYQLSRLGVDMVNVHAAGGIDMMKAAVRGLEEGKTGESRPKCIAVTQLTSTDQKMMENELLIKMPLEEVVLYYAKNAYEAGLDGVVCSPLESQLIHEHLGNGFLTVTPGIRLASNQNDDQKRVTTPALAKELGSSYIVVGRSITDATNPVLTYQQIKADFE